MNDYKHIFIALSPLVLLALAYLIWLQAGCELAGAMTTNGKICV